MDRFCIVCGAPWPDGHHCRPRGWGNARGVDQEFNLMDLCRLHHIEVHKIGMVRFAGKYSRVADWLVRNEWEYDKFINRYLHREG